MSVSESPAEKVSRSEEPRESAVPTDVRRLWAGRVHFHITSAEATFGRPAAVDTDEDLVAMLKHNGNGNGKRTTTGNQPGG
jgi:hypothetical protein